MVRDCELDRDLRSPHFRDRAVYLDESGDLLNGDSTIAHCAPFSSVVCHLLPPHRPARSSRRRRGEVSRPCGAGQHRAVRGGRGGEERFLCGGLPQRARLGAPRARLGCARRAARAPAHSCAFLHLINQTAFFDGSRARRSPPFTADGGRAGRRPDGAVPAARRCGERMVPVCAGLRGR